MKYGSVCSGVEAATTAWHPLGWEPQWFSEIEKFPSAVLAHHYPNVPNLGDMTQFKEWKDDPIDLLVGGTPCQSFSVAGLRAGLDDPRGNLMLTYLAIAERYAPRWIVWENVPGVLSSNGGRDFGTFLAALGKIGYGFRVFVVGYLGDWRRAAAVLFERESLSGHPAPSREARKEVAGYTATSFGKYSQGVGTVRAAGGDLGGGSETLHVTTSTARMRGFGDYTCDGTASTIKARDGRGATDLIAFPTEMSGTQAASAVNLSPTLSVKHSISVSTSTVRRLTPIECERLQGFPDDYTQIAWRNKPAEDCPVGPRYKAMGNSMAVPVMQWIGNRIQMMEDDQ